jgi:hypothetical protein
MQVKTGERIDLETPAKAEPADSVVTADFYTQLPQIRLTGNSSGRSSPPSAAPEVMLDGNDVAQLVECAIRHPAPNMRYAVLAAIWNHPDSFRQIFRFGLEAPAAFSEVREIVAQQLGKHSAGSPPHFRRSRAGRQNAAAADASAATSARPREAIVEALSLKHSHRSGRAHYACGLSNG